MSPVLLLAGVSTTLLYYTVLYCTVLYCTLLCSTVLYFAVLYCTLWYSTVQYNHCLYGEYGGHDEYSGNSGSNDYRGGA